MAVLQFMSFQIGISLIYPGVLSTFFEHLISLVNIDFLSVIPLFSINYVSREWLVEPAAEQLSFIGFESQSLISNLDTMVWMLAYSAGNVIFVIIGHLVAPYICSSKRLKSWFAD